MPPNHTHLGTRFFEFEYFKIIQDSFPLMLSCWNVTLRSHIPCRNVTRQSHNIVSKRDTPIQLSHYFISASLLYSRRHFNREGSRLEIQKSHNFRHKPHNQNIQPHNQVHRRLYNITQYISIAI